MSDAIREPIATTYGAILVGAFFAILLSGVAGVQTFLYFKTYPEDSWKEKLLVSAIWMLDLMHTMLICASIWYYFVTYFGDLGRIEVIPWSIPVTVLLTAIITFSVHCHFAHKILRSSKNNWWIVTPIVFLSFLRTCASTITTVEMTKLKRWDNYGRSYPGWVFTTGLALSTVVDILIMGSLCYYLQKLRRRMGTTSMVKIVNTLKIYTLENGALTCVATTASLICWLTMPRNLIFLGLHFMITKLYANSLLASLNTRNQLKRSQKPRILKSWGGDRECGEASRNGAIITTDDFVSPHPPIRAHALALQHPLQAQRIEYSVSADWVSVVSHGDVLSHRKSLPPPEVKCETPVDDLPATPTTPRAPPALRASRSQPTLEQRVASSSTPSPILRTPTRSTVRRHNTVADRSSIVSVSFSRPPSLYHTEPMTLEWKMPDKDLAMP